MITQQVPKKLKTVLAQKRPLSPRTEQQLKVQAHKQGLPLPVHESSLLPEVHLTEPLDLDDVLAEL